MKKIILLSILIVTFVSCRLGNTYEANIEYKQELKDYPSFLTTHFPDKIETLPIIRTISNDTTNKRIYYMLFELDVEKAVSLQDSISTNCLAKYCAADTNNVIIKSAMVLEWEPEREKYYKSISVRNKKYYPIPFFEEMELYALGSKESVFSKKTECGLSKDFIIYVLESKPGSYWVKFSPLYYMPDGWKNGYSKGISISRKDGIIIYWFILW